MLSGGLPVALGISMMMMMKNPKVEMMLATRIPIVSNSRTWVLFFKVAMNKTLGASRRHSWYPCLLPTEAKNDVNDDKDDGDEGGPWRPWVTLLKYRRICFASPSAAVQEGGGVARELTSGASPTRMHQHVFLGWIVMLFVWRALLLMQHQSIKNCIFVKTTPKDFPMEVVTPYMLFTRAFKAKLH